MHFCLSYKHPCKIAVLKKLFRIAVENCYQNHTHRGTAPAEKTVSQAICSEGSEGEGVHYLYKKREVNQTGHVNYLHWGNRTAFLSVSLPGLLCLF